uniref:DUF7932 domain-containing protein n=1 Tax=Mucochytrium quahogii TaxID=96639 RepID=A0A7S2RZR6_9STRA|mmetsp:Transcript_39507/g.63977  ORF Transcript_39507/g.63977 Transcript_39507/m.63977 type:complete len:969 (-) Transcript_39507:538-3444(-)
MEERNDSVDTMVSVEGEPQNEQAVEQVEEVTGDEEDDDVPELVQVGLVVDTSCAAEPRPEGTEVSSVLSPVAEEPSPTNKLKEIAAAKEDTSRHVVIDVTGQEGDLVILLEAVEYATRRRDSSMNMIFGYALVKDEQTNYIKQPKVTPFQPEQRIRIVADGKKVTVRCDEKHTHLLVFLGDCDCDTFQIEVLKNKSTVLATYPGVYKLRTVSASVLDCEREWKCSDEDAVFVPGAQVKVTNIVLQNVGPMPTPAFRDIYFFLSNQQGFKAVSDENDSDVKVPFEVETKVPCLKLDHEHPVQPGASITLKGSLLGEVPDISGSHRLGVPFTKTINIEMRGFFEGVPVALKTHKSNDLPSLQVGFPYHLTQVKCMETLGAGMRTKFQFKVLGDEVRDHVLESAYTITIRAVTPKAADVGPIQPAKLFLVEPGKQNNTHRFDLFSVFRAPASRWIPDEQGETRKLELQVGRIATPGERIKVLVDLEKRIDGQLVCIQEQQIVIKVGTPYKYAMGDILLVVCDQVAQKDIDFVVNKLRGTLGMKLDIWNISYDGVPSLSPNEEPLRSYIEGHKAGKNSTPTVIIFNKAFQVTYELPQVKFTEVMDRNAIQRAMNRHGVHFTILGETPVSMHELVTPPLPLSPNIVFDKRDALQREIQWKKCVSHRSLLIPGSNVLEMHRSLVMDPARFAQYVIVYQEPREHDALESPAINAVSVGSWGVGRMVMISKMDTEEEKKDMLEGIVHSISFETALKVANSFPSDEVPAVLLAKLRLELFMEITLAARKFVGYVPEYATKLTALPYLSMFTTLLEQTSDEVVAHVLTDVAIDAYIFARVKAPAFTNVERQPQYSLCVISKTLRKIIKQLHDRVYSKSKAAKILASKLKDRRKKVWKLDPAQTPLQRRQHMWAQVMLHAPSYRSSALMTFPRGSDATSLALVQAVDVHSLRRWAFTDKKRLALAAKTMHLFARNMTSI